VIVCETFERYRRRDGSALAMRKAARGWERKLTPAEHRIKPKLAPPVEWEYDIADALIKALERELMRPLRFSRQPSGEVYGPELDLLVAMFEVAVRTGLLPNRKLLRGKETRQPGSAVWFASRIRHHRDQAKYNGAWPLTASVIVAKQKRWNRRSRTPE
jgi:hypothetical protein